MAANSSIELTSLDFSELKQSLVNFLKTQDRFKDINYSGSNINALLDVLAYNTYHQSFYLNMVASEMFLDSAQLRSSIVSHAKLLNYVPRSFRSAKATVKVTLSGLDANTSQYFIPKGTSFSTTVDGNTYSFLTDQNISTVASNTTPGVFTVEEMDLYEGLTQYESYVFDYNISYQKFEISQPTVDTTSISVNVVEDDGNTIIPYRVSTTFLDLEDQSKVCFLQATGNGRYEIVFGDSRFVRKPKNGSIVVIEYRSCSGELPNNADTFTLDSLLIGEPTVSIELIAPASGGSVIESDDQVKFNAPRFLQTQERAITTSDYTTLLKSQYPEIRAVSAYGGEDADPPQYGKVLVSIDLNFAEGITTAKKNEYAEWLKTRMPLSIDPVLIDPEFIYVVVSSFVRYNLNTTSLPANDIQSLVQTAILNYTSESLDDFNKSLRYSRLVQVIDDSYTSIISNDTNLSFYKFAPITVNVPANFKMNFYNAITSVYSSRFTFNNLPCIVINNGNVLNIVRASNRSIVKSDIGSVNLNTGLITVDGLTIPSYTGRGIQFFVTPREKDVDGLKNNILTIRGTDIFITMSGERV